MKKHLIILDIDDTLTLSEEKHVDSLLYALKELGITKVNQDWKSYKHMTDSYIIKENYKKTFDKDMSADFILKVEKLMQEKFLSYPITTELPGAASFVEEIINHSNYAVCFATGSLETPAYTKLVQAEINFIPALIATANDAFSREEIIHLAMDKAKKYYGVKSFEHIISFGDGLWDVLTAKNLGVHFVGVNDKNQTDFEAQDVAYMIRDWQEFKLQKLERIFKIN